MLQTGYVCLHHSMHNGCLSLAKKQSAQFKKKKIFPDIHIANQRLEERQFALSHILMSDILTLSVKLLLAGFK